MCKSVGNFLGRHYHLAAAVINNHITAAATAACMHGFYRPHLSLERMNDPNLNYGLFD